MGSPGTCTRHRTNASPWSRFFSLGGEHFEYFWRGRVRSPFGQQCVVRAARKYCFEQIGHNGAVLDVVQDGLNFDCRVFLLPRAKLLDVFLKPDSLFPPNLS